MNQLLLGFIVLVFTNPIFAQSEVILKDKEALSIGEKIIFKSEVLAEDRKLNVYLPNGYHKDSAKTYPVIYLLDGSIDEDFIHISGIVQFGSFSWINIIEESIVVGVSNVDRKRDFTFPTTIEKDKKDFPTTGQSENFIRFIENELQPLIESNYKTNSNKTIIGQSLGGLLATEILLKKPDMFSNYIIVSPSLWWDSQSLLNYEQVPFTSKKSIYIAVGKEGRIMQRDAKDLYKKIKKGNKENVKLYFQFFKKQNHGDVLHLAVYNAFEKMFKREE